MQPTIVAPPNNSLFTVNETDMFNVTCNATGIPAPMDFVWLKDGVVQNYTTVPGANVTVSEPSTPISYSTDGGDILSVSQTLTFSSAMDENSGIYTCVASNGVGDGVINVTVELIVQGKYIYSKTAWL